MHSINLKTSQPSHSQLPNDPYALYHEYTDLQQSLFPQYFENSSNPVGRLSKTSTSIHMELPIKFLSSIHQSKPFLESQDYHHTCVSDIDC